MKTEKIVEIPYGYLRHLNWSSLVAEQIDIWDEVAIRRDPERTKIIIEYRGRSVSEKGKTHEKRKRND